MLVEFKAAAITLYVVGVHATAGFGVACIYMYAYAPLELCRPLLRSLFQLWR